MKKNDKYILHEYDLSLRNIIENGFDVSGDRTGVGTKCLFGLSSKYDVSERVPILTKRKVAWKSIVKEVLWYISGSSNINDLEAFGCNIWTPWKSKEFTDKHDLPEGSGGYLYGYNLIHFGANIHNENDKGFNQLDYVINTLKNNPKSRQACFTFWRPDTNNKAILPACHAFYSFIVSPNENGEMQILNCHLFQRSCDYPIGVGMANLFTGSLFIRLIANCLNMKAGTLYHSGAHCHIYHNAIDSTKEYLSRIDEPNSPILNINYKNNIYDYKPDDFELEDYNPLPSIKFSIAV
jgi:thymidylate synthase